MGTGPHRNGCAGRRPAGGQPRNPPRQDADPCGRGARSRAGRCRTGRPRGHPPLPPGGREGEEPPTGGTAGGTLHVPERSDRRLSSGFGEAEPPPMNMGGEAEHPRAGCPRNTATTAGPTDSGTCWPHDAVLRGGRPAGAGVALVATATTPCCRRTAANRSPSGIAPQGRPDDELRDSSQGLHPKGYGHARARRRSPRASWSAGGRTGRGRRRRGGRSGDEPAVAGDVPGVAFNDQAVTIPAEDGVTSRNGP